MKHLTLIFLCVLFLAGCQENNGTNSDSLKSTYPLVASPDQDTAKYVPLYLHDIPSDVNAQVTEVGSHGPKSPPPLNRYEGQVLTKGIWVTEFYVDKYASRAQKMAGTGQWLKFLGDGTFQGGHWQEQTHAGVWSINFTTEKPTLVLDSNVDNLDAWWEIHGITGAQDAMSWRRVPEATSLYNFGPYRKSIMVKMMELVDRPTKEQFAGQFNF